MERLREIVRLLSRPIEFAARDAGAHLSTVKNLGPFVRRTVVDALAEAIYLPPVETELLRLRELFADFDTGLTPSEQQARLRTAQGILTRLTGAASGVAAGETSAAGGPRAQKAETDVPRPERREDLGRVAIRFAKGVGPKRALLLERLGISTIEDALWFLPWRYEDRSEITPIARLTPGRRVTLCGVVQRSRLQRTARRGFSLVQVTLADETGVLPVVFFNQPYLAETLVPGVRLMVNGMVSVGRGGWTDLHLEAPQYEVLDDATELPLHVGRIVPVYHETKGLTSRQLRVLQKQWLDEYLPGLEDILPTALRATHQLPTVGRALEEVHFPPAGADVRVFEQRRSPAHRRLAFEELFVLQLGLALRKRAVQQEVKGISFVPNPPLLEQLAARLPFTLTPAQQRVLVDIQQDMAAPRPMHRLIQGDVGCGKTIVALHAILIACGSGYQAALMVPTEILAEQHYFNLRRLLEGLGVRAVLLKSQMGSRRQGELRRQIESGEAQVVIGTHALIQKGVRFARLGLAVIDEQHKFGVLQRKTLLEKGYHPDVLVMTATPIPRTLAMTVYGDLDLSVIDALPPGRGRIRTLLMDESQRRRVYQLVRDELARGRQAFIVYPLVEESEKVDLQAAIQAADRLAAREFRSSRVGLLHGRMKSDEKERVMAAFKAGEVQVLVATTVVEVGVDVANATVMVVEHAERFGLAQLHQLRGRVGRGAQDSYCFLVASGRLTGRNGETPARERLGALVKSADGFVIAEEDLRIRGPGEVCGVRQWGLPELRVADLVRDAALLDTARHAALALLDRDPHLRAAEHRALRDTMLRRWAAKLELAGVG